MVEANLRPSQLELIINAARREDHQGFAPQARQVAALAELRLVESIGKKVWLKGHPFRLTPQGLTIAASLLARRPEEEP